MGSSGARRVLVIRLSSLGDVARLLPSLRALNSVPGLEADLTTEDRFSPLLSIFPYARDVIAYPRRGAGSPFRSPLTWGRSMKSYFAALRGKHYDLALDLHGILRSALVAHLSGARECAGYARGFGKEGSHLFYGRKLMPADSPFISRYERYAGAIEAIGAPSPSGDYLEPMLPEAALSRVQRLLGGWNLAAGKYAVAFIGTSRAQRRKRWPFGHFLACAEALFCETGIVTVISWGPEEAGLIGDIPSRPALRVPPLLSLPETLALIKGCRLFIGADTGFTHLSALMGTPTAAIMGPTDPTLNRPFGNRFRIIFKPGIRRECRGEGCAHDDCMAKIEPAEVLSAALGLLEQA